ncbi:MAG: hypothetical protein QXG39_08970 [Candidatus Aenigmatarchaeota archaeon]
MSSELDITLEDVETAMRILQAFIKRSREASMILRRLEIEFRGSKGGYMPSFYDIMNMIFQQRTAQTSETKTEVEEFSEEDLKRIREIKEKIKKGNIK